MPGHPHQPSQEPRPCGAGPSRHGGQPKHPARPVQLIEETSDSAAMDDESMTEPTSLRLINTGQQRHAAERLWQLYRHDLSEFRGSMPDEDGSFTLGRFPSFRGLAREPKVIGEFFVVRAVRRQRVGYEAAIKLLRLRPGQWEIAFQEENKGAAVFWRRVAADMPDAAVTEERRPVPGKPAIPPDTWLVLST